MAQNNENIVNDEEEIVKEEEIEAAKEEAENAPDVVTIKLQKPVMYNNVEYTELSFDFTTLSAEDALAIDDELAAIGKPTFTEAFSTPYIIRVAARACISGKIGIDIFNKNMKMSDFNKIKRAARNFTLNLG